MAFRSGNLRTVTSTLGKTVGVTYTMLVNAPSNYLTGELSMDSPIPHWATPMPTDGAIEIYLKAAVVKIT